MPINIKIIAPNMLKKLNFMPADVAKINKA